jgi:hypothetical protein
LVVVHRLVPVAVARASRGRDDERGLVLVFTLLIMTTLMGVVALVVDLGNARQQERQAEAAVDAAALAGTQRIEDFGGDFSGSPSQWQAVVTEVKQYSEKNFGVAGTAWVGCGDLGALPYHPDTSNSNTCISADLAAWPAPLPGETALTNRLRVRLPTRDVPTGFGRVLDRESVSVGGVAVSAVTRATTSISTTMTEHVAGGPCALCVLGPGLSLDGQNGDITVTGGNVIVNSTAETAAYLASNGHVRITTSGAIGGPNAPANFSGDGYFPAPTHLDPVVDPLAGLPQCGSGSTCPTNVGTNGTRNNVTLDPGVYSSISGTHTLNPGIYVLKGDITVNGNDVLTGNGVMLYFACSSYPNPCSSSGEEGAGVKAPGNGSMRLTPPTAAQCSSTPAVCPYVGLSIFADRNNTAMLTYRGNGTNENGITNGGAGTFYIKSGILDLRGNGYTLASEIIVGHLDMNGNPTGVTIAYDLNRNVPITHDVSHTTTTTAMSYDAGGLVG